MKKIPFRLMMLLFLIGTISVSGYASVDIHVAARGSDRQGNGSKGQPFASLQKAFDYAASLSADDTLYIRVAGGDYYMTSSLQLDPSHSGKGNAPIVVEGEGSSPAVFYGGFKLGGFEKYNDKLWRVRVPYTQYGLSFEQLFVNGERRFRARTPNRGEFLSLEKVHETVIDTSATNRTKKEWATLEVVPDRSRDLHLEQSPRDAWNDIIFSFYHKWDVTRLRMFHYNQKSGSAFFTENGMIPWNPIDKKSKLVIENYFAALDAPGEWFFDKSSGYLYYMPMPGEDLRQLEVSIPLVDKFITLKGEADTRQYVEHITFRNLSFQVAGYHTPVAGNAPFQAASPIETVVLADFVKEIHFDHCEFSQTGLGGIWFRKACSNSSVRHCHIHDLGANGVKIGDSVFPEKEEWVTHHIVIDNNIIQHGGFVFPCAVGVILFHASDNEVTHNDIADFRYSGVSVGWVWGYTPSFAKRNKIDYNHIHHLGWGELSDMGGVYTLGLSEGTTVNNNVIHHIYSRYYGGWGLYTDEGSTGVTMANNLVYSCKSAAFHQHYGKGNLITNNILACQLRAQLEATRKEEHLSYTFKNNIIYFNRGDLAGVNWKEAHMETDYNCYWDTRSMQLSFQGIAMKDWKASGKDVHSVVADPGFKDADNFDFRFKRRNICRKIGFKPFDFTRAGVYGEREWKEKAVLPEAMLADFDRLVEETEAKGISQW